MDPNKTGPPPGVPPGGGSERPLGRGLEDISYLFLTPRPEPGSGEPPPTAPDLSLPPPFRPAAVVLRPCSSVTREELTGILRGSEGAIEDGLRGLDAGLPCHPCGEIDLLALDGANQLAIVDFETAASDALLLRGLAQLDWLVRNLPNVRRMYAGRLINYQAPPRLFLLAPQFSPLLRSVARQIARPPITWVRYQLVDMGGTPGILFERVVPE
jgi:hypothetical protein